MTQPSDTKWTHIGSGKAHLSAIETQLMSLAASGMIPSNGVIAKVVGKTELWDGSKTVITYSITDGKLIKHHGSTLPGSEHHPQLAHDAEGNYCVQPDDTQGVSKTIDSDPMWTIHYIPPQNALGHVSSSVRYKGSEAGARLFGETNLKYHPQFKRYAVGEVVVRASAATLTIQLK
jgi:hypothetical protein